MRFLGGGERMSGEGCLGILKGLLGFQKRMRMAEVYGDQGRLCEKTQECAEKMKEDLYMEALEEAIRCVEIVHGIGSECAE